MVIKKHIAGGGRILLNPDILFLLILVAAVAIRILLLNVRWINPDEGAHLLDARLLLEGQMPVADYGSRQPFYALVIAAFLKIFGVTFGAGRLMSLLSSVAVSSLLYLFAKRWFSTGAALVSTLIYAFLPLVVIWSVIVKTEPLAILLGVASMLLLLEGQSGKPILMVMSGILAALAFYVRQPTLYLPMAVVLYLLVSREKVVRNIVSYIFGYLAVTAAVIFIYLRAMSFQDILFSQLNPLHLVWNRLMHLFGWLPEKYSIVDNAGFRVLDQDITYTLNSWYHALAFSLFILVGAVAVIFAKQFDKGSRQSRARLLLVCWTGFIFVLYLYQTVSRGFYTQYFTEALPPLILLASISIIEFVEKFKMSKVLILVLATVSFYGIYLAQRMFWQITQGMAGYLVLSIGIAFLIYFFTIQQIKSFWRMVLWILVPLGASAVGAVLLKRLGMHDLYRFGLVLLVLYTAVYGMNLIGREKVNVTWIFLLVGFFYAAFYSGHIMGPKYEAVWAPSTVKNVAAYVREHGERSDEILSGGTIWTFESGLQPYRNVPHPTEFYKHRYSDFELMLEKSPPQFIILDGYTRRKFARYWDFIQEYIKLNYEKVNTIGGSKYPVEIYQLRPQVRDESGFMTQAAQ